MVLQVYFILGAVTKCMGKFSESKNLFKLARETATEKFDSKAKMEAYVEIAEAYSLSKDHVCALRCYKQLLQYAWYHNDNEKELKAYEGMAIENFYLGNMQKCNFLFERFMSGTLDDSNLRKL